MCVCVQSLERGSGQMYFLKPEEKMMYTWDNPTGRQGFFWQLVEATNANWLPLSLEEVSRTKTVQRQSLSTRRVLLVHVASTVMCLIVASHSQCSWYHAFSVWEQCDGFNGFTNFYPIANYMYIWLKNIIFCYPLFFASDTCMCNETWVYKNLNVMNKSTGDPLVDKKWTRHTLSEGNFYNKHAHFYSTMCIYTVHYMC